MVTHHKTKKQQQPSVRLYRIKSEKGYWLSGGFGYTPNKAEAGLFTSSQLDELFIDGCTLEVATN